LSREMYNDGFKFITNIDFSKTLIEMMKSQDSFETPEMTWIEADVRSLPFEDNSFDVAIDKGTMDALMCAKGDVWDPPSEVVENCKLEVDEVARILVPGGIFLYITFVLNVPSNALSLEMKCRVNFNIAGIPYWPIIKLGKFEFRFIIDKDRDVLLCLTFLFGHPRFLNCPPRLA
ncbi:hypothetical protein O181_031339, partial [Austropuccinia psidii MF-1]|nr:hypothetical protein [Austropuccinia psidii MF-1]